MTGERRVNLTGAASAPSAARMVSRLRSGVRVSTRVRFDAKPARISLRADDGPLPVEADGRISTDGPIRLCLAVDDLCLESDYELALDVLDEPKVATFFVRGRTEITTCRETPPTRRVCLDFADLPEGRTVTGPMALGGLTFSPLGDPLRTADLGDPAGQVKLAFPPTGLRVDFPEPVEHVVARVNQYAATSLTFVAYRADGEPSRFTRRFRNEVKSVSIIVEGLTAFEIIGGQNESSLVDVCFESSWPAVAPLRRENERRRPDG